MKETSPNPSDEPKRWVVDIVRIIHRVVNLDVLEWTRQRIGKLRLAGFLLRRSDKGKRFALGVGNLSFLAARFKHGLRERIHAIGRNTSTTRNLVRVALSPLVWASFASIFFVSVPAMYERFATSRGWPLLP